MKEARMIALDMDGTITQHRTPLEDENRRVLERLRQQYRIVIVGAGSCLRIAAQLRHFPTDIVGCYGMEISLWDEQAGQLKEIESHTIPVTDPKAAIAKTRALRHAYGYTTFSGDELEFHASGMITFPLLGTKADIGDKLSFDPDRSRRMLMYQEVCKAFSDFTVFIGGSSSFDIVPQPYNKRYALDRYCMLMGISWEDVIYAGDDYGIGGNDRQVYESDYRFVRIENYRDFEKTIRDSGLL